MGVDDDVVVDANPEEVLNGALCQLLSAVGVGGVDLVVAVPGNRDACVARNGEERGLVLYGVDGGDHERIAASHIALALVDAHDHDRRLVRRSQQLLLVPPIGAAQQAALGKECAGSCREDEDEDNAKQDVRPDSFFLC